MKKVNWKKQSVWGWILLLTVGISSCTDEKNYYDPNWERPHCDFTFDTEATTSLDLAYENIGFPTSVYFELYDQMPVEVSGTMYVKKEGVLPLFTGYTDVDGTFKGNVPLPSYLDKVYIYTSAFYAQTLIETTVGNDGRIVATDADMDTKNQRATRAGSSSTTYKCKAVTEDGWKTWLGEWDESTGRIDGFKEPATTGTTQKTILWSDDFSKYDSYDDDDELQKLSGSKSEYKGDYTINGSGIRGDDGWIRFFSVKESQSANSITLPDVIKWSGNKRTLYVKFNAKSASGNSVITVSSTSGTVNQGSEISLTQKSSGHTIMITGVSSGTKITFKGPQGSNWTKKSGNKWQESAKYKDAMIDNIEVYYETTSTGGEPTSHNGYAFTDESSSLYIPKSEAATLLTAHQSVININQTCPQKYRAATDMLVNEDAKVVISLLGGNTCWNSSLGYYYYKDGNAPKDLRDANVIMLFPNTQDGLYSVYPNESKRTQGVVRGTNVQLKFYGENPSKENESEVFPKGYRIGFVLACNTWTNRQTEWQCTQDQAYRAATSSGLSVTNNGSKFGEPRTAVYRYGDYVMISFEDNDDDENFSDVVFTLKTDPIKAITDIVTVEDVETYSESYKGIYGFEDIWPMQGDYDMNDLLVKCTQGTTFTHYVTTQTSTGTGGQTTTTVTSSDAELTAESFILKTFSNRADYTDGLACILDLPQESAIQAINYYRKTKGASDFEAYKPASEWSKEDIYNGHGSFAYNGYGSGQYNIIRLTGNVKESMEAEYKIEILYNKDSHIDKNTRSAIRPFIYIEAGKGSLQEYYEVHIPLEAPTNRVSKTWWSKNADASRPASVIADGSGRGEFYVRANDLTNYLYGPWYPFAIFLAGATETDLSQLLNPDNEMVPISKLYPNYENWVKSNGTSYTDWYKTTQK